MASQSPIVLHRADATGRVGSTVERRGGGGGSHGPRNGGISKLSTTACSSTNDRRRSKRSVVAGGGGGGDGSSGDGGGDGSSGGRARWRISGSIRRLPSVVAVSEASFCIVRRGGAWVYREKESLRNGKAVIVALIKESSS